MSKKEMAGVAAMNCFAMVIIILMIAHGAIGLALVGGTGGLLIALSGDVKVKGRRLPWQVRLGEVLCIGGFMSAVIINYW
ncbi:MAG: hypothetical protein HZA25_00600 [Candidatus Niyogibacteria bacterium]|nr:hypothetical protein [Candidatus Niyogibacteria bacterium]